MSSEEDTLIENQNQLKDFINKNMSVGNYVYVPTPEHGYAKAEIIKIDRENNNKIKNIAVKFVDTFLKETYGDGETIFTESNIQKLVPKGNEIVRPSFWMSQNRKSFPTWINKTFLTFNTCEKRKHKPSKTGDIDLFVYQEFVRDYIGHSSPYRGILIYHGLGSGKTCSAIAIAENLRDTRNVVIFLPASLRNNFINQGLKKCGDVKYRQPDTGNKLINDKYTFISYNASNVVAQIDQLGSLDNKIIIIDEAHNLATMAVNGLRGMGKQGVEIYRQLLEAKNSKFIFLSGTPLVNTPFELTVLFNILRGPLEVILLTLRKFNKATEDDLIGDLLKDERVGYAEINEQNQSMIVFLHIFSWDLEFEQTIRFIENTAKKHNSFITFLRTDSYPLFPETEEEFVSYFVKKDEFINKTMFQRRILGLTSYYRGRSEGFPDLLPTVNFKVPMSNHQYELYEMARDREREKERQAAYQRKVGDGGVKGEPKVPTLARVFSREFSNFVFPDSIIRPFKAFEFISRTLQEEREDQLRQKIKSGEITKEEAKKQEEKNKEERKKMSAERIDSQIKNALNKLSDPSKSYLLPGKNGLGRYSPKMEKMLDVVTNQKGLILVYSAFRRVEGLEIFARVLERNGYERYSSDKVMDSRFKFKRFAFYSGQEDFKERKKITDMFTNPKNKEGEQVRILLASSAGTEGLDLKNIRAVLIMEPYWHEIRIQQVIGRAVRRNSHIDLPEKERNVKVYRFESVLTPEQKRDGKEKISSDEYVASVAKRKEKLNNSVLEAVKEAAVDCTLNQCANDMSGKCFKFAGKEEGLAFLPDISRDLTYGYQQTQTREVVRKLRVGAVTEDSEVIFKKTKGGPWYLANEIKYSKKPQIAKTENKVVFNPETLVVYDYNTFKQTQSLSVVGRISGETGKWIKE